MSVIEKPIDVILNRMTTIGFVFWGMLEAFAEWCSDHGSTEAGVLVLSIMPALMMYIASFFVPAIVIKLISATFAFGLVCVAASFVRVFRAR